MRLAWSWRGGVRIVRTVSRRHSANIQRLSSTWWLGLDGRLISARRICHGISQKVLGEEGMALLDRGEDAL